MTWNWILLYQWLKRIKFNLFQIYVEFVVLEIPNSDTHKGLLKHPFSQGYRHEASYFEDVKLQIDHHKLQENSEKERVVLDTFENEEWLNCKLASDL